MIAAGRRWRSHWGHVSLLGAVAFASLCAAGLCASGLAALASGAALKALIFAALAAAVGLLARRRFGEWRAARRGARARRATAAELRGLLEGGWQAEHAVPWPGGGVVETLLRSVDGRLLFALSSPAGDPADRDLGRLAEIAAWLTRTAPNPCIAVCAVEREGVDRLDGGILLTSRSGLALSLADAWAEFTKAAP